ncbi:SCO3933 family regulatory protein [Streptomyces sp. NPDC056337]|uniref:SCO3933 family regulatory protein n=1 Tax=Streptomyces sp. NPDC056337 TaxID=3345787 RepID=UPI0035DB55F8
MQSIPVDTTRLGVLRCAIAPEAKLSNPETQEVKKDRDGNPVYTVAVTVRQDRRRISVIEIAVSGEPKGIQEGQIVKVTGLTAFAWAMGDRHGISFRADAITPISGTATAQAKGGDA